MHARRERLREPCAAKPGDEPTFRYDKAVTLRGDLQMPFAAMPEAGNGLDIVCCDSKTSVIGGKTKVPGARSKRYVSPTRDIAPSS